MAEYSIFPDNIKSGNNYTLEGIAGKLYYFEAQLQQIHWQTSSYAEHKATNELYDYISDFRDNVIEKLMGYMVKKPQPFKIPQLTSTTSMNVVSELCDWSYNLIGWAKSNEFSDIENIAQELNGAASKTKYLLTLS
jgi:hypothetical protein